jgi:peptidoglycan/xylan/chitin deacetylase (PgdA/CDA1 family)
VLLAGVVVLVVAGFGVSRLVSGPASTTAAGRSGSLSDRTGGTTSSPHSSDGTVPAGQTSSQTATIPAAPPGQAVPILMYHVIAQPPPTSPYPDLYVPPDQFAMQMRALRGAGYHAVTLYQVWRYWHDHGSLPVHPVVLSFDDGYLSQFSVAARLLKRLHWPGVLNLAVIHLHEGSYGLVAGRVRKMIAWGWEVDSHTIHHIEVTGLTASQLHSEIAGSRAMLRREFHVPVWFFCYPSGAYDQPAIDAVRAAGYLGATTTQPGLASPHQSPDTLNRIRINPGLTAAEFLAQLRG